MTSDVASPGTDTLYLDAASTRFAYRRRGPRGGVPLVLLHRFRGTIDWWDPEFLERLTAERDVIWFDNIGIGYSAGEAMTSVEGFAAGAIEFIEALGLSEVDLLGWKGVSATLTRVPGGSAGSFAARVTGGASTGSFYAEGLKTWIIPAVAGSRYHFSASPAV